ncbi:hypothetical protein WN48_08495 [Eufriesea mexicana]|uniref:C2H2-type domain-containing protein n=2 Tax=Eufriesea mexicana TaxID=516756 RepID=A0A310SFY4_9HYME|nr:hypothetical protein WN48_08495 [Eufriesea mexicana]
MSNSDNTAKKINIPNGVKLRDCRVVILRTICELCGKYFKCETDLNMHITMKHQAHGKIPITTVEGTSCAEVELWNKPTECLNYITDSHGNFVTKVHKKISLILKIGEEIVSKIALKRKHLKKKRLGTCIQNKLHHDTKLIIDNDVYENVSCIDPAVFVNSPYQCRNSVHALQSPNRYLASNIVAGKQAIRGKSITQGENYVSNELKKSCALSTSVECDIHNVQCKEVPFKTNLTFVNEEINLHEQNITKNSNSTELSSIHSNNVSVLNETCHKLQLTGTSNPILDCDKRSDSIKSLPKSTDTSSKPIVQTYLQNSETKNNKEERDMNANQVHKVFTIDRKEQSASEKLQNVSNMVQVIVLPIIVPNNNAPSSPFKLTIQSSSMQQKEQQQEKQGQQQEVQPPQESQPQQQTQNSELRQELIQNCIYDIEDNSDDEVQEVLRIVRRCSTNSEVNHESPTRFEQEMLVQDAIKDMKKMEEGGWHLLDKKISEATKKRKRNTKTNSKGSDVNDESAKKKKKTISEPNSDSNLKNLTGEKYISNAKEHAAKVQSYNSIVTMWASDNVKENLTCNKNVDVSSEMLRRYGINYYNEVFEINNNTENIQEPVSRFLVPCSGGIENRSNGPAVIDLVYGTDE